MILREDIFEKREMALETQT